MRPGITLKGNAVRERFRAMKATLRAHLDQVPLSSPSENVDQPCSTGHFNYGFTTVQPLS